MLFSHAALLLPGQRPTCGYASLTVDAAALLLCRGHQDVEMICPSGTQTLITQCDGQQAGMPA